jgi:flagella basal body P-ring formation protein FlgA
METTCLYRKPNMPSDLQLPKPMAAVLMVCALVLTLLGWAPRAAAQDASDLQAQALVWARQAAAESLPGRTTALKLEVSVGSLDSRLKLAPCGNVETFLPVGSRLWGKTRVGVRCTDGVARWSVTLPATVKALGPAWVVKSQVASGAVLTREDVMEAHVDWAEETHAVLAEPDAWLGQVATRQLNTGQVLRQGMVKAAQVFQAGAQVKVIAQGPGFQVSGEAQALSAGVLGQLARVKMDNGRVASGTVLDARTVKIEL